MHCSGSSSSSSLCRTHLLLLCRIMSMLFFVGPSSNVAVFPRTHLDNGNLVRGRIDSDQDVCIRRSCLFHGMVIDTPEEHTGAI